MGLRNMKVYIRVLQRNRNDRKNVHVYRCMRWIYYSGLWDVDMTIPIMAVS